jgi:hypothetical protein
MQESCDDFADEIERESSEGSWHGEVSSKPSMSHTQAARMIQARFRTYQAQQDMKYQLHDKYKS